jgi:hypothetical protein
MVFIRAQEEVISKDLYLYIFIFIYLYIFISFFLRLCVLESLMIFFHFLAIFSNLHLKNRNFFQYKWVLIRGSRL